MLGLVVGLAREAARQVRVVPVLVELALGIGEQLLGLRQRHRGVTADSRPVRLSKQVSGFGQVLRLDGDQLGIAVQDGRLTLAALRAPEVATLQHANRLAEFALCLLPEFGFELRSAGIGGVLAALHHLCQCGGGQLGRFRGRPEIPNRFCSVFERTVSMFRPRSSASSASWYS